MLRRAHRALLACAFATIVTTDCRRTTSSDVRNAAPPLGVLFAGWYGFDHKTGKCVGGLGSTHWNDGPDTAGIVHTPIAARDEKEAFYCSSDPARIKYQLDAMEDAGITFILFSWWGWGDSNLDGVDEGHPDQWIEATLLAILKELDARKSPIKVAILVEPFTWTQAHLLPTDLRRAQHAMVFEHIYSHFYEPYRDHVFALDGAPLVATFDPMLLPDMGITKPTRLSRVDWWPRTDDATIELVRADGPSRVTTNGSHVRVELADGARASDVVHLVSADTTAREVVGATLPAEDEGIVDPSPMTSLARFSTLSSDVPAGATKIPVGAGAPVHAGDTVTLSSSTVLDIESARIRSATDHEWLLESPTRHAHAAGSTARANDARWTIRWLSSRDRNAKLDAEGWQWWLVPQQRLDTTLSSDGMAFLNHRFTEYYLHMAHAGYLTWPWRNIDPMLDKGVYESQWQWALDHRKDLKLILLYSWNFYGELAQIEPSVNGPAPPTTEYLERTKRYYRELRDGETKLH